MCPSKIHIPVLRICCMPVLACPCCVTVLHLYICFIFRYNIRIYVTYLRSSMLSSEFPGDSVFGVNWQNLAQVTQRCCRLRTKNCSVLSTLPKSTDSLLILHYVLFFLYFSVTLLFHLYSSITPLYLHVMMKFCLYTTFTLIMLEIQFIIHYRSSSKKKQPSHRNFGNSTASLNRDWDRS